MPNWCNNTAVFRHADLAQAEKLLAALENKALFSHFLPCPQELLDATSPIRDQEQAKALQEKYGFTDWYSWALANWGTKWDTEAYDIPEIEEEVDDDGNKLFVVTVSFDTAWSPPTQFFEHMSTEGWNITGYYIEWGMNFCGIWDDGIDETFDIPQTADDVYDELPQELDEMFAIADMLSEREELE